MAGKKLTLAILTQNIDNESCRLLKKQMEALGARVDFIQFANAEAADPAQSYDLQFVRGKAQLVKDGRPLDVKKYDGVMMRCWGSEKEGHAALEVFANAHIPMANDFSHILAADSKVETFYRFAERGIPIPATEVIRSGDNVDDVLSRFKKFPLTIKRDVSCRGNGVFFADSKAEAVSIIGKLFAEGEKQIVLQQFIRTGEKQKTHRCLVINGKPVATLEFTAKDGSRLSNFAQGGSTKLVTPPPAIPILAMRAAKAMKLPITGVDIITDEQGNHYALEANDSPNISLFPNHGIAADRFAAEAFVEKIQALSAAAAR
jgi:RimK family alpha-L-glutamate ligase